MKNGHKRGDRRSTLSERLVSNLNKCIAFDAHFASLRDFLSAAFLSEMRSEKKPSIKLRKHTQEEIKNHDITLKVSRFLIQFLSLSQSA